MPCVTKKGSAIGVVERQRYTWKAYNCWGNTRRFRLARHAKAWVRQSEDRSALEYLDRLKSIVPIADDSQRFTFLTQTQLPHNPSAERLMSRLEALAQKHDCRRIATPMPPFENSFGQFDFFSRRLYVQPTLASTDHTHTLAHELAHYFDSRVSGLLDHTANETEQFIEAVAYAVLATYHIDTGDVSANYIRMYQPHYNETVLRLFNLHNVFSSEDLRNAFLKVYNEFIFELDHLEREDV